MKALVAWVAGVLVILGFVVVAWWNPPPTGITPEDIRQMSATERRVLTNCQLLKISQKLGAEYDVIGADERAQESGLPVEYILYKDGYWCDKQERHDFWTRPQYD
jgi:hypothetical protein